MKAIEVTNATIPMLWESAQQGCAGIGCQLHPLEVKRNKDEKMLLDALVIH